MMNHIQFKQSLAKRIDFAMSRLRFTVQNKCMVVVRETITYDFGKNTFPPQQILSFGKTPLHIIRVNHIQLSIFTIPFIGKAAKFSKSMPAAWYFQIVYFLPNESVWR